MFFEFIFVCGVHSLDFYLDQIILCESERSESESGRESVPEAAPSNQIFIQKENLGRQREEKSHNLRPSSDYHGKIMLRLVFLSLRSTPLLKTSFPFHGSDFLGAKYGFFSLILSRSSICLGKKNKNFLGFFNSISNRKIMPCN